jgi:4-aminobutyrate aminotransferase-like enzyme
VEGDDLRFYPPLIITREQVDEAMDIIDASLTQLGQELP